MNRSTDRRDSLRCVARSERRRNAGKSEGARADLRGGAFPRRAPVLMRPQPTSRAPARWQRIGSTSPGSITSAIVGEAKVEPPPRPRYSATGGARRRTLADDQSASSSYSRTDGAMYHGTGDLLFTVLLPRPASPPNRTCRRATLRNASARGASSHKRSARTTRTMAMRPGTSRDHSAMRHAATGMHFSRQQHPDRPLRADSQLIRSPGPVSVYRTGPTR